MKWSKVYVWRIIDREKEKYENVCKEEKKFSIKKISLVAIRNYSLNIWNNIWSQYMKSSRWSKERMLGLMSGIMRGGVTRMIGNGEFMILYFNLFYSLNGYT